MYIYKFGGASVKNTDGIINLKNIIQETQYDQLVIVVSAMGKITNDLENIAIAVCDNKPFDTQIENLFSFHRQISQSLLGMIPYAYTQLETKLKKTIEQININDFAKAYDQITPFGELMSTTIIYSYLQKSMKIQWLDARTVVKTDQYFSEANVDWIETEKKIKNIFPPLLSKGLVITQGFIGSDEMENSTTLGKEGSDYTGAILAYCLNAKEMTVWKDVKGILNADPHIFDTAELYEYLSYREVTEMTYYGAKVIHPKTLKPLAQKKIPLKVRSFKNLTLTGTLISPIKTDKIIPCFIFKNNQLLITAQVKDHSFMDEKKLCMILQVLDLLNIKINLMQNSALTLSFCIDNKAFKAKRIRELLNRDFVLFFEEPLNLATIKNYRTDSFHQLPKGINIIMEQKTPNNYQILYK